MVLPNANDFLRQATAEMVKMRVVNVALLRFYLGYSGYTAWFKTTERGRGGGSNNCPYLIAKMEFSRQPEVDLSYDDFEEMEEEEELPGGVDLWLFERGNNLEWIKLTSNANATGGRPRSQKVHVPGCGMRVVHIRDRKKYVKIRGDWVPLKEAVKNS
jgi:hypothetical protein